MQSEDILDSNCDGIRKVMAASGEPTGDAPESWHHRPGHKEEEDNPPSSSRVPFLSIEDDAAAEPRPQPSVRYIAAAIISLSIHAALMAWIVHGQPPDGIGAAGHDLEAVSIEVVSASALESLSVRASAAMAGSAGAVAETTGADAPPQDESQAVEAGEPEPKTEVRQQPPPPDILAKPDPAPVPDEALVAAEAQVPPKQTPAEIKPADQPPEPLQEAPAEPIDKTQEKTNRPAANTASEAQVAVVTGGATALATAVEAIEAEAAAGASPGELARYAMAVRVAIGRTRPRHGGIKGTVVVSFELSPSGSIERATVDRSSGNPGLDRAALAAVRAAEFPKPPAGSTYAERSYSVPFDFR